MAINKRCAAKDENVWERKAWAISDGPKQLPLKYGRRGPVRRAQRVPFHNLIENLLAEETYGLPHLKPDLP